MVFLSIIIYYAQGIFHIDFQGNESQAVEKLHQLELNSNPASRSLLPGKEITDVSGVKPSLVHLSYILEILVVHLHMHLKQL